MKPTDLRIGNLVMYNGEVVKVEQITKHKIGYHTKPNETRMNYARLCEIEPIPISEDVLAGLGFVRLPKHTIPDEVEPYTAMCKEHTTKDGRLLNIPVFMYRDGRTETRFDSTHLDIASWRTYKDIPLHLLQNLFYFLTSEEI